MQYRSSGNHIQKGIGYITMNDPKQEVIFHPNPKIDRVSVYQFKKEMNFDLVDYLEGGLQINLVCCVDFTGSNAVPTQKSSLHYIDPRGDHMNQYQSAIRSIGEILLHYDSDKMVPCYGFGARTTPNSPVSHFFPLSFNSAAPDGFGVDGIFQLYESAVRNVELAGPTLFAPLMENIVNFAQKSSQQESTLSC